MYAIRSYYAYESRRWPAKPRVVKAVNDISLRLHAGETIGIVGETEASFPVSPERAAKRDSAISSSRLFV